MGAELRPICPACLVDSLVVVEVFLKSNDRVILNNTSLLARCQLSQFDVAAVTSTSCTQSFKQQWRTSPIESVKNSYYRLLKE